MNESTNQYRKTVDLDSTPRLNRLDANVTIKPSQDLPGYHEISFPKSDGVFSKPPINDEGLSGHVHVHRWELIHPESSVKKKWLKILGQGIASYFSIVKGQEKYTLANFPSGYQIFHYVKDSNYTPYLFGYPTKSKLILKFRTANEFLPHLIWLASSGENNKCTCRNCQRNTLRSDGLQKTTAPLVETKITKESRQENHGDTNTIPTDMHYRELPTNFRLGELVWCELDPKDTKVPLNSKYWPGICQETRVTLEPYEVLDLSTQENPLDPNGQPQWQSSRDMAPTLWKSKKEVRKKRHWYIQLLGLSNRLVRIESQILPWLYHPFEESAWNVVSTGKLPLPGYLRDPSNALPNLSSLYNPAIARLSFQFAVQIAGEIEESCAPAEHLEKIGVFSFKPTSDQIVGGHALPIPESSSRMPLVKSMWLGAENIRAADFVRLNMLSNKISNTQVAGVDCAKQVLFLHIDFFWKLPSSDSVVVTGRIFELVNLTESSSVPIGMGGLQQPRCTWLRQFAHQAPRGLTIANSDEIPPPPKGLQFLKITPVDKIHHLDLRCIAGRYYSHDIAHEGLRRLRHQFSSQKENDSSATNLEASNCKQLKSLLGIRCGQENHMRIFKMKPSRAEILQQALKNSGKMMSSHFRTAPPIKKS